jgi:hypothetical protein
MTGAWSFLTLAGPRYAIRNATEDLMVNLAIGQTTPWGLAKSRYLSTRLNTAIGVRKGLTKGERRAEDPLGAVMRIVNKKKLRSMPMKLQDLMMLSAKLELPSRNFKMKNRFLVQQMLYVRLILIMR